MTKGRKNNNKKRQIHTSNEIACKYCWEESHTPPVLFMEIVLSRNKVEALARFREPRERRPTWGVRRSTLQGRVFVRDRQLFSRLTHSLMVHPARDEDDCLVFVACPDEPSAVLDSLLPWARLCLAEVKRHFQVRGDMNLAQTIGGGWASVKNVRESLRWALILRHLGRQLKDGNCERKCEVFIGWAHLWNGNKGRSLEIFTEQLEEALSVGDDINWNRCTAALSHARHNPEFSWDGGRIPLPAEITDQTPQRLIDASIQRRNISKGAIGYADPEADDMVDDNAVEREWQLLIS